MIEIVRELDELRAQVGAWTRAGLRVGFVPTMGNLHPGHHSLVRIACERADRVVASVFVNPTQFGPREDFARYPRTPQADADGLAAVGCDLVWMPSVETMYPFGATGAVRVQVPGVTDVLEGAHRPGHFDGVATVVARLFNQVRPDIAVFGRKDYQQFAVIQYLVRDLAFPVELVGAQTLREADGLAMSSRNQYLTADERPRAAEIHRCLQAMREGVLGGAEVSAVEADARRRLESAGYIVDYAAVRTAGLAEFDGAPSGTAVALIAARLGTTRLIDNLEFEI
ncbi:pantoate--beta-alanine ligase [Cognatilysobacter bugurensis]|uniref:Pantothenate synthetase n=1 Tax=Cognatilysobacter bugurensis TaxID=543356 RepID=A0A918W7N0_9GAMM|nr:pantoate--beta-alanine ligase [Lysobacter bugurensis]GHA74526.1 pantothenate synthetase [Lysobacter bugurensis]